jgi:hypothetical protein
VLERQRHKRHGGILSGERATLSVVRTKPGGYTLAQRIEAHRHSMIRWQEGGVIPVWSVLLCRDSHTSPARWQSRAPREGGTAQVLPSEKIDLTRSPAATQGLPSGPIRTLWQQARSRSAESQLESPLPVHAVTRGTHPWTGPSTVRLTRDRPRHARVGRGLSSRLYPRLRRQPAPRRAALNDGFDGVAGRGPDQPDRGTALGQRAESSSIASRPGPRWTGGDLASLLQ